MTTLCFTLFAWVPGASAAQTRHPSRPHHSLRCKKGYTRKRVKRHRDHKTVRVYVCVKAKPRRAVSPLHLASPAVKLHAHLDPSYARSPGNPFAVTYAYSAAATTSRILLNGAESTEPDPVLPEGILNLYNDGLLACSIPVGNTVTEGHCPVAYGALGAHTVTTTYISGSATATETDVEDIEPLGVSVLLSIDGESFSPAHEECEGAKECERLMLGHITAAASLSGATGPPNGAPSVGLEAPVCTWSATSWGCTTGPNAPNAESVYEWVLLKHESNEPEEIGLVNTPTLPAESSEAWAEIKAHPLTMEGILGSTYVAKATFASAGYVSAAATSPFLLAAP